MKKLRQDYDKLSITAGGDSLEIALTQDLHIHDRLPARLYRDNIDERLPALLFIHSGGWTVGSIEGYDALCRRIARESGWTILSIGYRLAPENPYPAMADDTLDALRWIHKQGNSHNLDASRIAMGE